MTEVLDETEQDTPEEPAESPETPDGPESAPETPDEPDEAEEPAEEPAAPSGTTETEYERVIDAAFKYAGTYRATMEGKLGPMIADVAVCPRCADFAPGYYLPAAIGQLVPEQKAAILVSIGEGAPVQYRQDKLSEACPDCDAEGKVETGSHVKGEMFKVCDSCHGRGWIGPRAAREMSDPDYTAPVVFTDNGHSDEPVPAADPWGRPPDHHNYGVMPGFERD